MTQQRDPPVPDDGFLLPGLDGSNPLGFLAALGILRLLTHAWPNRVTRMGWKSSHVWLPRVCIDGGLSPTADELLETVENHLIKGFDQHPVSLLGKLDFENGQSFRQWLAHQVDDSSRTSHASSDWLAALASDPASPDVINPLQTVRRDYFQGNLKSVIETTRTSHLRRCLFAAWDYADALDNQSLHWDPSEDRRHALQWNKPSGDPDRKRSGGMLGANRLAIEAIPLFVSFREGSVRRTAGFSGNRSTDTRWTWPIWDAALDLSSVTTLLSLADLQAPTISPIVRRNLQQRGVAAVFRSDRILVQKTPNFTPARLIA
ncbi:MAG: hypothetical protein ABL993_07810 [Vicinamibacterales bacterium]